MKHEQRLVRTDYLLQLVH